MATIKSYTDLLQSKKLAEILPLESANMHYSKDFDGSWFVDLARYTSVKIPKYVGNIEEHLLPCWSLAALFSVLPKFIGDYGKCLYYDVNGYYCGYMVDGDFMITIEEAKADNPIDACYEMILKLHELKML